MTRNGMTQQDIHIGFIGGGNMAHAIIGGLLRAGHAADRLAVSEPVEAQHGRLRALHIDLCVGTDNAATARSADVLVIAVKPQIIDAVGKLLREAQRPDHQLLISIAAGIRLDALREIFAPTRSIVRVMPNQPALVGAGMSVLTATDDASAAQRARAQYVAEAMGRVEWLDNEDLMDAVTAVSGSGPAYFYLLMELIEAAARDMGLPASLARTLARQTGFGAGQVAALSDLELAALRESVTSKGGTTAAALASFEQAGIRDIVKRALRAARDRSIELGAAHDTDDQNDS